MKKKTQPNLEKAAALWRRWPEYDRCVLVSNKALWPFNYDDRRVRIRQKWKQRKKILFKYNDFIKCSLGVAANKCYSLSLSHPSLCMFQLPIWHQMKETIYYAIPHSRHAHVHCVHSLKSEWICITCVIHTTAVVRCTCHALDLFFQLFSFFSVAFIGFCSQDHWSCLPRFVRMIHANECILMSI